MKKLIVLFFVLVLVFPATASAQFTGLRPNIAEVPEYKVTVGFPLIPTTGLTDLLSVGQIFSYVRTIQQFEFPNDFGNMGNYLNQAGMLIEDINKLRGKDISLGMVVLPTRLFGLNTKYFELTIDGGAKSNSVLRVRGLREEISVGDLYMEELNGFLYTKLRAGDQEILSLMSTTMLGGDIWAIGKAPIKLGKYTLTLLAGIGFTVAYMHTINYSVCTTDDVGISTALKGKTETSRGLVWAAHGMLGAQFDGFKYLRPRVVFQYGGRPQLQGEYNDFSLSYNVGIDLKIWKIATFRGEIRDVKNPKYFAEFSRRFGVNSEVAFGGVFKSEIFGTMGYATLGLGGKPVKVTTTILFDKKRVGLMFGVTVGYMPQ